MGKYEFKGQKKKNPGKVWSWHRSWMDVWRKEECLVDYKQRNTVEL